MGNVLAGILVGLFLMFIMWLLSGMPPSSHK